MGTSRCIQFMEQGLYDSNLSGWVHNSNEDAYGPSLRVTFHFLWVNVG